MPPFRSDVRNLVPFPSSDFQLSRLDVGPDSNVRPFLCRAFWRSVARVNFTRSHISRPNSVAPAGILAFDWPA